MTPAQFKVICLLLLCILIFGCASAPPVEFHLVKHDTLPGFLDSLDSYNRHKYRHCYDGIDPGETCPGGSTRIVSGRPRIDIWIDTPIGYWCAYAHELRHIGFTDGRYHLVQWHHGPNSDC